MTFLQKKQYTFFDYFRVVFNCIPRYFFVNVANKIINAIIPSIQVLVVAKVIDSFLYAVKGQAEYIGVIQSLGMLIIIAIHNYLASGLINLFNTKERKNFDEIISTEVIRKRASLQYRYIEHEETWNIVTRSCDEASSKFIQGFDNSMSFIELVLRIMAILTVIWFKMWWGSMVVLIISVPLMWLAYKNGKTSYDAFKEARKFERRSKYLSEVLTSRQAVEERTLFQYTQYINDNWLKTNEAARRIKLNAECKNFVRMKTSSIITAVLSFIIISFLLVSVKNKVISAGLFISLSSQIQSIIHIMSWDLADLIENITEANEYLKDFTLFANLSEVDGALIPLEPQTFKVDNIEFRNVSFRYPEAAEDILKNVSFNLVKGKVYAFVGPNGAGKTTIIKLLTGLYDNYEGEILVNGHELRSFSPSMLQSLIAVVFQDFVKYEISIREIMQLGIPQKLSDDEILESLLSVGLKSVSEMKNGVDTDLGRTRINALDISGGQWQKISVAHALLRTCPIHILDEPTAALDPVAESCLYEDFKRIVNGDINILITHRLGAAKIADEIIVFNNGQVLEQGNHENLILKNGLYSEMFNSQKGWYL